MFSYLCFYKDKKVCKHKISPFYGFPYFSITYFLQFCYAN